MGWPASIPLRGRGFSLHIMRKQGIFRRTRVSLALAAAVAFLPGQAFARQNPPVESGAAPPQQQSTAPKTDEKQGDANAQSAQPSAKQKDDRIFGVMPNYSTVDANGQISSISKKEKFKLVAEGAFDPYEFVIVGLVALKAQADDADAPWGKGASGYGIRYGAAFADQAIGNFMTGAIFPSFLHQDPRYFRMGHGGFRRRTEYALTRLIVTRSDAGREEFNYSEVFGNGVATGLSTAYHTAGDRTADGALGNWATQIATDGLGNFLKEFWPDVKKKLTRHKSPS